MSDITNYLKRNWEGGLIGAVAGLISTWVYQKLGYSLTFALTDAGLVDKVISAGTTAQSLAFTKVGILMIILMGTAGLIIDQHLPERWWRRYL
jgi:predicted subunit of tRNA(5-methylaminomethyl-2-thiouridylate) methyltransferase